MKKIILISLIVCLFSSMYAQTKHDEKMGWWREARFGMFIHWGPYSILGGMYNGHQHGGEEPNGL